MARPSSDRRWLAGGKPAPVEPGVAVARQSLPQCIRRRVEVKTAILGSPEAGLATWVPIKAARHEAVRDDLANPCPTIRRPPPVRQERAVRRLVALQPHPGRPTG